MGYLREKWTEGQVLNLPEGEHNYFERKGGELFADMHKFQAEVAKALSALVNSGGGHLILGQKDDGSIDGMPPTKGSTTMRQWLEQKLPNLLSYPLESFRVHAVEKDSPSQIPPDKELLVIDVGDSHLAPHQAAFPQDKPQYYYRVGGHSVVAPHHYLEALRNRLTAAVLDAQLTSARVLKSYPEGEHFTIIDVLVGFAVTNKSRVASYKWELVCDLQSPSSDYSVENYLVIEKKFPEINTGLFKPRDRAILPTRTFEEFLRFGFRYDKTKPFSWEMRNRLLSLKAHYYPISENHIGETRVTALCDVVDSNRFEREVQKTFGPPG